MRVRAIILAAGASRRMGTQKLLLPFGGTTVIEHVMGQVAGAGIGEMVVVVGADRSVEEAALRHGGRIVRNEDPERGMLSSVRCGLGAVGDDAEGVVVVLGDQPSVKAGVLRAMVEASGARPGKIVVPTHGGRRGHPLLIPIGLREEVMARYDKEGLRGLLGEHAGEVVELPCDESVLEDIDEPEDYRRALKRRADGQL